MTVIKPRGLDKVKLFMITCQVNLANWFLKGCTELLYVKVGLPHKILIFRTGSMGDSICALPALRSIREHFPEAKIDILTHAGSSALAGLSAWIPGDLRMGIKDYSAYTKLQLLKHLFNCRYDAVIQLPQVDAPFFSVLRDLLFFRIIAKSGWGWVLSQSRWFRKTQNTYWVFDSEADRLQKLLQTNGVPKSEEMFPWVDWSPADMDFVKNLIAQHGGPASKGIIALVPGAKRQQNRWPLAYFGSLVERFQHEYTFIAVGGKEDQHLAQQLQQYGVVGNCCGLLTPRQSAALLSLCELTISNDTGPMHLSYAVGTPTVALFSNRDLPGKWYPPASGNIVHRASSIPCTACFSETCPNNICMQAITPQEVMRSALQLLKKTSSSEKITSAI